MKTRKRLLAIILAVVLAMSMVTPGFVAYGKDLDGADGDYVVMENEPESVESEDNQPGNDEDATDGEAAELMISLLSVSVGDETELRGAVASTVGPTTIELTANVALTTGFLYIPSGSDITLIGNYALSVTVDTSVIDNRGTLTLDGITITGGNSAIGGGGVWNGGTLNMLSGEISGNNVTFWQFGGGVFNAFPTSTFNMYGGTISNNTVTAVGGGVYNNGTFILNDGTISNNLGNFGGGGVTNRGIFTMNGGTISGNTSNHAFGGGGVRNDTGIFTMNNGIISGNAANDSGGGGVRNEGPINEMATFIMHGGTITGNTSYSGGGVSNASFGHVYIHGGTISNNITNNYAGIGNHGTLTMNGGIISGNTALVSDGGGVGNSGAGANFTMNGGTITNNTANNNGGGVLSTFPNSSFTMNNGLISDNSATNGDGVYVNLFNSGTNVHNGGIVADNTVRFIVGTHVALITILTQPQLAYTAGDALNLDALIVRLTLGNGSTQDVAFADFGTNGLTVSPADGTMLAAGHNGNPVVVTHTVSGVTGNASNLSVFVPATPTAPSVPQNFTAVAGNGQVALGWTVPLNDGGSAITGYEVSSDNGVTWVAANSNTGHTFTGLTNGSTYTFRVRAVNNVGNGAEASATATPIAVIDIKDKQGVTVPVLGATPVTAITPTAQFTGTITWAHGNGTAGATFGAQRVYTATITLTPETGFTLQGVAADSFTVAGAASVSNPANSGVITAVFPATSAQGGGWGGGGTWPPAAGTTTPPTTVIPVEDVPLADYDEPEDLPQFPFIDVTTTDWFYPYVRTVWENQLFQGTSYNMFTPQGSMTRAMFIQVLYRIEHGELIKENENPDSDHNAQRSTLNSQFADVSAETWYHDAMQWATEQGLIEGVGNGDFQPNIAITREEMAVILHNYVVSRNITLPQGTSRIFTDHSTISAWALEGVSAIQAAGIILGHADGRFAPRDTATRAEVAAIFARFWEIAGS